MSDYPNDRDPKPEGGLFSEDYESPKRENPYLRKNREKSKPAREPKPKKEPRSVKTRADKLTDDKTPSDASLHTVRESSDPAVGDEGYRHRRTVSDFLFEHAKLIAAVLTICVVLSLVLITDVVSWLESTITAAQDDEKEPITLTYVEGLTEKAEPITWSDFTRFRRETMTTDNSVTWVLEVEGTDFEVWISGVGTQYAPTYVYMYDMNTGERMDLNEDDFRLFVDTHS